MARITVLNENRSLVIVNLDGRQMSCPNGSKRDAICDVVDGVVVGPEDLIEKIKSGALTVTDWHGFEAPEGVDQPESTLNEAQLEALSEAQPKTEKEAKQVLADVKAKNASPKQETPAKVKPPTGGGMLNLPPDTK